MAKILIGGDIVPTKSNYELFRMGNREELIGKELCGLLDNADYAIFNLEVPLINTESPIVKCGPNLIAPTDSISGLKAINPYFFTLANNHILDQGRQGLDSTREILGKNKIAYAGAGNNLEEASKSYITERNGIKIGIYCCAEHEFSIATKNRAGANPYDPLYSFDHVRKLKSEADIIIVLFHGGKEYYRYPSPELQRIFHKFAEVGADYVIAQHTHCIGCVEEYLGAMLVYGQGNFLFDYSESEYWKTSVLMELMVDKVRHSCRFIPLEKQGNRVMAAKEETAEKILDSMNFRSREILISGFVQKKYQEFAEEIRKDYFMGMSGCVGKLFIIRAINKLTNYRLFDLIYSKKCLLAIENYFECESHRELAAQIAKRYTEGEYNEP